MYQSVHNFGPANDVHDGSLLERSLSPLWKLTYYSGLLFDWCRPMRLGCASVAIHCVTIIFFWLLTIYNTIAMITELAKILDDPKATFQQILILFISFSNFPLIFIAWSTYLLRRKSLLIFFRDWSKLEKQELNIDRKDGIDRICIITYGLYFSLWVLFVLSFAIVLGMSDPNVNDDLIFHFYPELINTPMSNIRYLTLICVASNLIFILMVDIVPILVYYHIAKAIEKMDKNVSSISAQRVMPINTEAEIYRIWSTFEKLAVISGRADDLFGPTIIFNHGASFFIICGSVFSVMNLLKNHQKESDTLPLFCACLVFFPARLLFSLLPMLKVHSSASKLLSSGASFYNSKLYSLEKEERRVLRSFTSRVQHLKLAVCPSGFYRITRSFLLTILSIIVSYTVLFIQST